MLKDIQRPQVEDIAIAVLPDEEEGGEKLWKVFLLNLKDKRIDNVIVASKGYGSLQGEEVKTSVLRHYLGSIEPGMSMLIEPIQEKVFGLNNEYWVSFYIGTEIFDKRYVFLPESIQEDYFTPIPLLGKRGVMIR